VETVDELEAQCGQQRHKKQDKGHIGGDPRAYRVHIGADAVGNE
jgi:hypothetical protein